LSPDLTAVSQLAGSALIVTSVADPGQGYDFISRVFAPDLGIPEDPVTGSAHTVLAPFWSDRLGRTSLVGLQASARSGEVGVEIRDDRVTVRGRAVTVLDGLLTAAAGPT
jgi:predicted PhzF superfamily epimerase YddE/YHI9